MLGFPAEWSNGLITVNCASQLLNIHQQQTFFLFQYTFRIKVNILFKSLLIAASKLLFIALTLSSALYFLSPSRFFSTYFREGSSQLVLLLFAPSSTLIFIFAPICVNRGRLRPKQISCFILIKSPSFLLLIAILFYFSPLSTFAVHLLYHLHQMP